MDRLARHLDDLRRIVHDLTKRGVRVEFVKEHLIFSGDDSPMAVACVEEQPNPGSHGFFQPRPPDGLEFGGN